VYGLIEEKYGTIRRKKSVIEFYNEWVPMLVQSS